MTPDRYTRIVLTIIAAALVYLCLVFTAWPSLEAQTALRPGDSTGPAQVVIVGWRAPQADRVPITTSAPMPVAITGGPVPISGQVTTERSSGRADRVVLVGWEEAAVSDRLVPSAFRPVDPDGTGTQSQVPALPVSVVAK
jgi:hypothetical protein